MKSLLAFFFCFFFISLNAQSYNLRRVRTDSSSSCTGTLYDSGGPNGRYSGGDNGHFIIQPVAADSIDITFTFLYTEPNNDEVFIYDHTDSSLIGVYSGYSLPNNGQAIRVRSGAVRVYMNADNNINRPGFALNWIAYSSTNPVASFQVSKLQPALKEPIVFSNTSSNGSYSYWDFGDGTFSTDRNPVHAYSSPGNYVIRLIESNCHGSDTVFSTNSALGIGSFQIPTAPNFTLNTDTLRVSAECLGVYRDTIELEHLSGGPLYFEVSDTSIVNDTLFQARFENNLWPFRRYFTGNSNIATDIWHSDAGQGNGCLKLSGGLTRRMLLNAKFEGDSANYFRFMFKTVAGSSGEIFLAYENGANMNNLGSFWVDDQNLFVYGTSTNLGVFPIDSGVWNVIEYKDFDFKNARYTIYLNGDSILTEQWINVFIPFVNHIGFHAGSPNTQVFFDGLLAKRILGDTSLRVIGGVNATSGISRIPIEVQLRGTSKGLKQFNLQIKTNSGGADSILYVPVLIDVIGTPFYEGPTHFDLDSSYIGIAQVDSILIWNSGCDTLRIDSTSHSLSQYSINILPFALAPDDSTFLPVGFQANALGYYPDTLLLFGNVDTAISLNTGVYGHPVLAYDSLSVSFPAYDCEDSLFVQFHIRNGGNGPDLNFSLVDGYEYFDDFEHGLDTTIWQSQGSIPRTSGCYSRTGPTILLFRGLLREAVTKTLDLRKGDSISFWVYPGDTIGLFCDQPEAGENLYVQYRKQGDLNWRDLDSISGTIPGPNYFSTVLPEGGLMQLRLFQPNFGFFTEDNYLVDDFRIKGSLRVSSFSPNSGTIPLGDSVLISGYITKSGLNKGTYTDLLRINSNDPIKGEHLIPIQYSQIGKPELWVSQMCLNFDTVYQSSFTRDSLKVENKGCGDLQLSSFISSSSQFVHGNSPLTVLPDDSTWVYIDFTPNISQNGYVYDTLEVINNDTILRICLQGYVQALPTADFTYTFTDSCQGVVQFDASLSAHYDSLSWDFNDSLHSSLLNPTHTFGQSRAYQVSLKAFNPGGYDSISKVLNISKLELSFTMSTDTLQLSDTVYFSANSPNAISWHWDFGDGTFSTLKSPKHHYPSQTIYTIILRVTDGRGCTSTSSKQLVVENRIGLEEELESLGWQLFPNPSNGHFSIIRNIGNWEGFDFQIVDARGSLVFQSQGRAYSEQEFKLNLPKGIYQVQIFQGARLFNSTSVLIVD